MIEGGRGMDTFLNIVGKRLNSNKIPLPNEIK
jgi:hypothetical protein